MLASSLLLPILFLPWQPQFKLNALLEHAMHFHAAENFFMIFTQDLNLWIPLSSLSALEKFIPVLWGFPGGSDGKESACNARGPGSIPGSRRSPEERSGYPLQYSCLWNSMDREAWRVTVHGVTQSMTECHREQNWVTNTHFSPLTSGLNTSNTFYEILKLTVQYFFVSMFVETTNCEVYTGRDGTLFIKFFSPDLCPLYWSQRKERKTYVYLLIELPEQ